MDANQSGWRFRAIDHPLVAPIAAFNDNYIWLLHDPVSGQAAVVDPGDAEPVLAALEQRGLHLAAILVTHHHRDHTGGIAQLVAAHSARVFGPATEAIAGLDQTVSDADRFTLWPGGPQARVLEIPGHTRGHIAYVLESLGDDARPLLFCGDTLFAAGCGRVFEGTAEQMLRSLERLAGQPDDTLVYCAHEYTVANLRFAQAAEPDSPAVAARLDEAIRMRAAGHTTLPSTIAIERATNPFLRVDQPGLRTSVARWQGAAVSDRTERFGVLRQWKNEFR
jgi:hydroxyacylglutathione hydrolase